MLKTQLKEKYSPMYFLAALGNGGLAVSFFMYVMFMIKHPNTPIPIYDDLMNVISGGSTASKLLVVISVAGIIYFSVQHIRMVIWNVNEYKLFKSTEAYKSLWNSNGAAQFMTIPLTFAMSINVLFIIGALFVPGLWGAVEYLFPLAIIGFTVVGVFALKTFIQVIVQFFVHKKFDAEKNNSFIQMMSAFAFIMVAVGFAASAAMSKVVATSAIAAVLSIAFLVLGLFVAMVMFIVGLKGVLDNGFDRNASATIWLMLPILTLAGITVIRLYSGVSHNLLHSAPSPVALFVFFAGVFGLQTMFGIIGYFVMKRNGYFDEILRGDALQPGLYSLICPGVAYFVLGMFFIGWGLVKTSIVIQFSWLYFVLLAPIVFIQIKSITTLRRINKKMLY